MTRSSRTVVALAIFAAMVVPLVYLFYLLVLAFVTAHAEHDRVEAAKNAVQANGLRLQHAAIARCRKAGGFAVMGFSEVVCVEAASVKWSEEIPW